MLSMTAFYLVFLIFICLVAYAGLDATMRLFAYMDLHLRYSWVQFRMSLMRRKLRQQLIKDLPQYNKTIKELQNNDRK